VPAFAAAVPDFLEGAEVSAGFAVDAADALLVDVGAAGAGLGSTTGSAEATGLGGGAGGAACEGGGGSGEGAGAATTAAAETSTEAAVAALLSASPEPRVLMITAVPAIAPITTAAPTTTTMAVLPPRGLWMAAVFENPAAVELATTPGGGRGRDDTRLEDNAGSLIAPTGAYSIGAGPGVCSIGTSRCATAKDAEADPVIVNGR
jgi:hypothetical protein